MVLNYIFVAFILIAFLWALIQGFRGDFSIFSALVDSTFSMSQTSVDIALGLVGVMSFWLGIMKVGERAGLIAFLSKLTAPFFGKLFPSIPKGHHSIGAMIMNFSANMLGLDNAATPLGLKAMQSLQEINPKKDTASDAQILFLVLNSSGLTLIPVSILALRASMGAAMPTDVFVPILITTFCSSLAGLLITSLFQKINLFSSTVLTVLLLMSLMMSLMVYFFLGLSSEVMNAYASLGGNFMIALLIVAFILFGLLKKQDVYANFIDGAKEGFQTSIQIIPYLVAMLFAIGFFRASGALDHLMDALKFLFGDYAFIDALPTAFMKPLSGSGARAMMVESMQNFGPDSLVGRITSIMQGSTETTFYVLAVYFGSVKIKYTRHAAFCGVFADMVGVLVAICMAYLFFS